MPLEGNPPPALLPLVPLDRKPAGLLLSQYRLPWLSTGRPAQHSSAQGHRCSRTPLPWGHHHGGDTAALRTLLLWGHELGTPA